MSSAFQTINGLQQLVATPTGDAGQAINGNFLTIGSALAALPSTYLTLSGGTITGNLTVNGSLTGTASGNLTLAGGTVTGSLGALSGSFIVEQSGGINQIDLSSTNSGKTALVLQDHSQNPVFTLESQSIAGTFTITGTSSNVLLTLNNATNAVSTIYNTLDDGGGDAEITGDLQIIGSVYGESGGNSLFTTIKGITVDGGGNVLTAGLIGSVLIPFNCTVSQWTVISQDGTSGSIAFDVQTVAEGSFVPNSTTNATSIVGAGTQPALSSATVATHAPVSWTTTSLNGGYYLIFVTQNTPASIKSVRIELTLTPR